MELLDKLGTIEEKYEELSQKLSSPELISDPEKLKEYGKKLAGLSSVVPLIKEYRQVVSGIAEAKELLEEEDEELRELAKSELKSLEERKEDLERKIRRALVTPDPRDDKDIIVEIRAGTGGEEAALFAADLYRLYSRYAEQQGWKVTVLSSSPSDMGGFKEIIFEVKGKGAYSRLKYESGVHRVQRVPVTEASGRIHTSTATVAILPEPEEVEVKIDPDDLRIDVFRSTGPGGQSVNTTDSAVRITHLPTGIVVSCQEERSQIQNRERAMKILRSRLYELYSSQQRKEIAQSRRMQVGTAERAEKIRTYNFPQGRVTDHRIGLTIYRLDSIMEGRLDELIDALVEDEYAKRAAELQI